MACIGGWLDGCLYGLLAGLVLCHGWLVDCLYSWSGGCQVVQVVLVVLIMLASCFWLVSFNKWTRSTGSGPGSRSRRSPMKTGFIEK